MVTPPRTLAASAVLLLALAGCGKQQADDTAATADTTRTGPQGSTQLSGPPGASGEVADVSGRTMQVQNPTVGQVAVTWTAGTTFTRQIDASLADVSVGDCVMVTSSSSPSTAEPIAADQVRITSAVAGECTGGRGSGAPGQLMTSAPQGMPTDLPSDLPSNAGAPMQLSGGAIGKVTAVSPSGFTVASVQPAAPGTSDETATTTTTAVSVTVSDDTAYTRTAKATSAAVHVGACVDARGTEDSMGAIKAASVAVSPKVDGQCGSFGPGGPMARQGA
jgi:hypothetical protein